MLGLIGPNGAGKSTLVSCITGVLRIDGGTIRFQDGDIQRLPPHQRARRGIARTFQKVRLRGSTDGATKMSRLGSRAAWFGRASGWPLGVPAVVGASVAEPVNRTLERVGLADISGAVVRSLPFGQRSSLSKSRARSCPSRTAVAG